MALASVSILAGSFASAVDSRLVFLVQENRLVRPLYQRQALLRVDESAVKAVILAFQHQKDA
jgi:hypothetical protein